MKRSLIFLAVLAMSAAACAGDDPAVDPTDEPTDGAVAACEPAGTELAIAAEDLAFDTDCLAAPAGEAFTITFENRDADQHNVAIYTDDTATESIFQGELFAGPETMTYDVSALEAGEYFFRCDVHPDMTGTFVVA